MIKIVNGDLLDASEIMIVHQVNCKGVMGSGVAKSIRERYPKAYDSYKKHCNLSGSSLLGKIQVVNINQERKVVNMFAQDSYGRSKQYTDLKAFKTCVLKLVDYAKKNNIETIAMPYKIGCGRGGADWDSVYSILCDSFNRSNVDLTLYAI